MQVVTKLKQHCQPSCKIVWTRGLMRGYGITIKFGLIDYITVDRLKALCECGGFKKNTNVDTDSDYDYPDEYDFQYARISVNAKFDEKANNLSIQHTAGDSVNGHDPFVTISNLVGTKRGKGGGAIEITLPWSECVGAFQELLKIKMVCAEYIPGLIRARDSEKNAVDARHSKEVSAIEKKCEEKITGLIGNVRGISK